MGAAASALRHRGRLQLDAGSVKAPFSRQKSRKIATVTKAPAKKSPAARNVVTHLLIPYRRRRCAAGRNPTPHGRTCGAAPTLRAGPNAHVPTPSIHPSARASVRPARALVLPPALTAVQAWCTGLRACRHCVLFCDAAGNCNCTCSCGWTRTGK